MLSLDKALELILNKVKPLNSEKLPLFFSLGRVLAKDIRAQSNLPSFNRAAMDGYALKASLTKGATRAQPRKAKVVGVIRAGERYNKKIKQGEAVKIMTGAPLPSGSDGVIMVEDTQEEASYVQLFREIAPGENVSEIGEDVKKGEIVLKKGKVIQAAEIGMLAGLGQKEVRVVKKPKVAIISTGDEIASIEERLKKGQTRDSNSYSLWAQVLGAGGEPRRFGVAKDVEKEIKRSFNSAVRWGSDIIILSGGVSVGDYDIVQQVLVKLGVKVLFWKVAIKPGKPVFCGTLGNRFIFGLPGYPVSSMVTFELLVKPTLAAMLQKEDFGKRYLAVLDKKVVKKRGRREFLRGVVSQHQDGIYHILPVGVQKSSALKSLVLANALIELPEDAEEVEKGSWVYFWKLK
jgi:molybdopterin molybdotransferase